MPKFNKRKRSDDRNNVDNSSENSSINDEDLEDMVAAGIFQQGSNTQEEDDNHGTTTLSSSSSSAQHKVNLQRQAINDKPALLRALESVQKDLPWLERLEVVSAEPILIDNIHDDLKVELAFHTQALDAVIAARGELERLHIPYRRPDDYFAEMLKSDDHMAKVKARIIEGTTRMTAIERRQQERNAQAFAKQSAVEKAKQKASEKRSSMDALKQWRKNKDNRPELSTEDDLDELFRASKRPNTGKGTNGNGSSNKYSATVHKSGKRRFKDKKFGHGGPKHFAKENTSRSSRDMSNYSVKGMKQLPSGFQTSKSNHRAGGNGGAKKHTAKGGARPGKWARSSRK